MNSIAPNEVHLLIFRHAQTDRDKKEGKIKSDKKNYCINKNGQQQAKQLAERIQRDHPDISAFYCSHLLRAKETARIISKLFNKEIRIDARLKEMPEKLQETIQIIAEQHLGQKIVIVTHGKIMRLIAASADRIIEKTPANCSMIYLVYQRNRLTFLNYSEFNFLSKSGIFYLITEIFSKKLGTDAKQTI